jgi:hypothetical protein
VHPARAKAMAASAGASRRNGLRSG